METVVKRDLFYAKLHDLIASKRENSWTHLSQERYSEIISEVNSAKIKCKNSKDHKLLRRFDVIKIKGKDKLIAPFKPGVTNIQYYLTNEELFDILVETHKKLGYAGRQRLLTELQFKYKNITTEIVRLYLYLWKRYKTKRISERIPPLARIGDTVEIKVPENYRGPTGAKNVLAVVIGIEDTIFYKLANRNGTLRELYSREQFAILKEKLISINEISTLEMTLAEAAADNFGNEEEDYRRCHCKKKCYKTKCSCRSKRLLCNSYCHNGSNCCNK